MSGLPHPFEAAGDALPNRTGGGIMNVREALDELGGTRYADVDYLAPIMERALRAAIRKAHSYGCSGKHLHAENENKCLAAGVAAMVERDNE